MKGKTVVRTEMSGLETVVLRKRQEAELEATEITFNHLPHLNDKVLSGSDTERGKFKEIYIYRKFKYIKYLHLHTLHLIFIFR